jgi:hypothetical protein
MSIHIFSITSISESTSKATENLRLLTAYEDGSVSLWARRGIRQPGDQFKKTVQGKGWEALWNRKLHIETGVVVFTPPTSLPALTHKLGILKVMGTTISRDLTFAMSVSADNIIGKYVLPVRPYIPSIAFASFEMRSRVPTRRRLRSTE